MPTLYVMGKIDLEIDLSEDYNDIYKSWTNKRLAAERKKYDHPHTIFWLELDNYEDPISPFCIVLGDNDIYEGEISVEQNGRNFNFLMDGKAKIFVHKLTKNELDKGRVPMLCSVTVNGVGMSIKPRETSLIFQFMNPK